MIEKRLNSGNPTFAIIFQSLVINVVLMIYIAVEILHLELRLIAYEMRCENTISSFTELSMCLSGCVWMGVDSSNLNFVMSHLTLQFSRCNFPCKGNRIWQQTPSYYLGNCFIRISAFY